MGCLGLPVCESISYLASNILDHSGRTGKTGLKQSKGQPISLHASSELVTGPYMDDDPALVDAATSTMSLLMLGGAALGLGAFVLRRYRRKAKPEPAAQAPEAPAEPEKPATPPFKDPPFTEVKVEAGKPLQVKDVGLATPESVIHDMASDVYLVSNIEGNPLEADGKGFISRVLPSGKISKLRWIDGATDGVVLNAPKGMALVGDRLYVTDLDHVRIFDRKNGEPIQSIPVPGATFLNDLAAAPDGTVYVSDSGLTTDFAASGTDAIYRIKKDGSLETVVKDPSMNRPNGLLAMAGTVWAVTFGAAEIFSVNTKGERVYGESPPAGSLDGLILGPRGNLLFSSWEGSCVFRGSAGGPFTKVIEGVDAPADIAWDAKRSRLLIPLFKKNILEIHVLPEPEAAKDEK